MSPFILLLHTSIVTHAINLTIAIFFLFFFSVTCFLAIKMINLLVINITTVSYSSLFPKHSSVHSTKRIKYFMHKDLGIVVVPDACTDVSHSGSEFPRGVFLSRLLLRSNQPVLVVISEMLVHLAGLSVYLLQGRGAGCLCVVLAVGMLIWLHKGKFSKY